MNYTLRGKIAKAHPYQLDKTLTVEGAGAEAEATGKAINAVKKIAEDHIADKENPHKVTKAQVGLGNVDNTADTEKPVSKLQELAIADAKKAGTDAQTAAYNAKTAADNAQTAADNAQTAADNAQTAADNAQASADNALTESKNYSDGKHAEFTVTLTAGGWAFWDGQNLPWLQTVDIEGILETDKPHWGVIYSQDEKLFAEKEAFAVVDFMMTENGKAHFTCFEEKPSCDLNIQIEVNR